MVEFRDPVPFVMEKGSLRDKLVVAWLFDREEKDELLSQFLSLQTWEGSWPWMDAKGAPGSVPGTARAIGELIDLKAPAPADSINKACSWILLKQRRDGGWAENKLLSGRVGGRWVRTDKSCTWITGACVIALLKSNFPVGDAAKKAERFLLKTQDREEGGWPPYPGSKVRIDFSVMDDVIEALYLMGHGSDSPVIQKALSCFWRYRPRWGDPINAISILRAYLVLGYGPEEKAVKDCIQILSETQNEDGGWSPKYGLPSNPTVTRYAAKVLHLCGVL